MKLKKGSAEAKAWGRRMKKLRNSKSNSQLLLKGGRNMVKKKSTKRKTRSYGRSANNGAKVDLVIDVAFPVGYGYLREVASDSLANITKNIPLGYATDELLLGTLGFIGAKKLKNKTMKKMCHNILIIEGSRVGTSIKDFGLKKTFLGN